MRVEAPLSPRLIGLIALVSMGSAVGTALAPALLVHAPLGLIALSPTGRHLVLTVTGTGLLAFVLVAALRRTLASYLAFRLGELYGERALEWSRTRAPRLAGWLDFCESSVDRAGPLLLFLAPGLTFSGLAGASGMPTSRFLPIVLVSQTTWMIAVYLVGDAYRESLSLVVQWVSQYMVETTALSACLVVIYEIARRRSGQDLVRESIKIREADDDLDQ
jgi:uncharacterized membrane protein YdjX (TVP38/TMEM64 family)